MKNDLTKALLLEGLDLLLRSREHLEYSLQNCKSIGVKDDYTMSELTEYESLSSRYARTSDILTQKVLKTLFIYLQENAQFFMDRCNLSEKIGLVDESNDLYNIRKLRNEIAHDYTKEDISEIFRFLVEYSDLLIIIIGRTKKYIDTMD